MELIAVLTKIWIRDLGAPANEPSIEKVSRITLYYNIFCIVRISQTNMFKEKIAKKYLM